MAERYSEPYEATGGLAAEGVVNQLGRPDIEALEVLVREGVQNCWDARRLGMRGIRVEIGRRTLDGGASTALADKLLPDPPVGLPLADQLVPGVQLLYFADFGTDGLGGPTRADRPGDRRDFVDFVRNIGQPPDKDLGGGSFGYGKAAFYIASRARTILVDTLCLNEGSVERRFIGCGLGEHYEDEGRPFTGRHWWGQIQDGVPEPLLGAEAEDAATQLGLPEREGESGLGTTVVVVAPEVSVEEEDESDATMKFIAEALAWNFWPRMIDTPGSSRRSMEFKVLDGETEVRIPNPRTHERLGVFVEAMDRLREEPGDDDDLVIDRSIEALRPAKRLGRLVLQRGVSSPVAIPNRAVPQGARLTSEGLHHVALMRNAELVVKYLPAATPVTGRFGYAGAFKCAVDVDEAFRMAEPPTHDDWVARSLPKGSQDRSFVKIALERIASVCREAAGFESQKTATLSGSAIPMGEFADAMAQLMPGSGGIGARRPASDGRSRTRRSSSAGRKTSKAESPQVWAEASSAGSSGGSGTESAPTPKGPPPRARVQDAELVIGGDGEPLLSFPVDVRANGNRLVMAGAVEVMSNDGAQVEGEAPVGAAVPNVDRWIDPAGSTYPGASVEVESNQEDGVWRALVPVSDDAVMRLDLTLQLA